MILSKVLHMSFSLKVNDFCIYNSRLWKQYDTELPNVACCLVGMQEMEARKIGGSIGSFFPPEVKTQLNLHTFLILFFSM